MDNLIFILCAMAILAMMIFYVLRCEKYKEENRTLKLDNAKLTIQVERRDVHIARLREMKNLPPVKEGELDAEN